LRRIHNVSIYAPITIARYKLFAMLCFPILWVAMILNICLSTPNVITLYEGQQYISAPTSMFRNYEILANNNNSTVFNENIPVSLVSPLRITASEVGEHQVSLNLGGILPIKKVNVDIRPNIEVVPGGNTVGIKLDIEGALVVSLAEVYSDGKSKIPAKEAGMKVGDIIRTANGQNITTTKEFTDIVNAANGNPVEVIVERNNAEKVLNIAPLLEVSTGYYKIGAWIRDASAGIGTLTFFHPESGYFGALGHGIVDSDTRKLVQATSGKIVQTFVSGVKKGDSGDPGELIGSFSDIENNSSMILGNNQSGIYGSLGNVADNYNTAQPLPVAMRDEVKTGMAYIRSNINGNDVEEFEIEIVKVMKKSKNTNKNMVIKVTDPRLIEATGGIVQGMSGSPIIQNGKLIGAVTHVFVNDPQKGYGCFIENMLGNLDNSLI